MSDWTSKLWEAWQKSKRSKKPHQIGRRSYREAVRSPKGARNRVELDVEAAGKQLEVQKEQETASDWTSKQQNATQKSTHPKKNHHITHQIIPTSRSPQHNHIFSIIPHQYQLHMRRIRQEI